MSLKLEARRDVGDEVWEHLEMRVRLKPFDGNPDAPASVLCCPECGNEAQHPAFVASHLDGKLVRIRFKGECGHDWLLDSVARNGGRGTFLVCSVVRMVDLRSMPYDEYLRTNHWHDTRTRAVEAAGHRCQVCNVEGSLEVHHRTYERRGAELPADLTVLCADCHAKFHDKLPKNPSPSLAIPPLFDETTEKPPTMALRDRVRGVAKTNGAKP